MDSASSSPMARWLPRSGPHRAPPACAVGSAAILACVRDVVRMLNRTGGVSWTPERLRRTVGGWVRRRSSSPICSTHCRRSLPRSARRVGGRDRVRRTRPYPSFGWSRLTADGAIEGQPVCRMSFSEDVPAMR